jgi:hypothetical protein
MGSFPGASGNNGAGGAGGHTGASGFPEGGGGGGGGVFGGGGGGAGASGMNASLQPTNGGGGGGAGGSSLAPSGGSVQTAAPGAVPGIVLTWTAPPGSDPTGQRTLTVIKSGSGSGVVSSSPTGIDCGATCSSDFGVGTSVTLTPTPANDSTFSGWSGACSGSGSCEVTMGSDKTVAAAFATKTPGTPPNTVISKAKINQDNDSAKFTFTASDGSKAKATSGFQCALVKRKHAKPKFKDCKSPKKYRHLKPRKYTFQVRAFDPAGKDTTPAKKAFRIK